jgi:hypothetical protein
VCRYFNRPRSIQPTGREALWAPTLAHVGRWATVGREKDGSPPRAPWATLTANLQIPAAVTTANSSRPGAQAWAGMNFPISPSTASCCENSRYRRGRLRAWKRRTVHMMVVSRAKLAHFSSSQAGIIHVGDGWHLRVADDCHSRSNTMGRITISGCSRQKSAAWVDSVRPETGDSAYCPGETDTGSGAKMTPMGHKGFDFDGLHRSMAWICTSGSEVEEQSSITACESRGKSPWRKTRNGVKRSSAFVATPLPCTRRPPSPPRFSPAHGGCGPEPRVADSG